jgi:hypothetical protein
MFPYRFGINQVKDIFHIIFSLLCVILYLDLRCGGQDFIPLWRVLVLPKLGVEGLVFHPWYDPLTCSKTHVFQ